MSAACRANSNQSVGFPPMQTNVCQRARCLLWAQGPTFAGWLVWNLCFDLLITYVGVMT